MKLKKLLGIKAAPKKKSVPVSERELRTGLSVRNRYILKEQLGEGGFGEVWLANDKLTGTQVALKFFHEVDNNSLDEFVKEYTLLGGMAHPNLLSAQHFDKWGSRPFIVMKYCSKGTASSLCGSISEQMLWKLIHDVASGLAYLQSLPNPIVHQDLKPSNIMINETGNFMLSDFGISKKIENAIMKKSTISLGEGCIPYMGPERFHSGALPVLASDIWSLGASIYELATGELPFGIVGGAMQSCNDEIPELDDKWSTELNDLMRACLSKDTWDRPSVFEVVSKAEKHLAFSKNECMFQSLESRPDSWASHGESYNKITRRFVHNNDLKEKSTKSGHTSNDSLSIGGDSIGFVDLGLSVRWSDCFCGAKDIYGLGIALPVGSNEIPKKIPCENLPSSVQIRELIEKCVWQPRKIGRSIVGFNVIGPNGKSIYVPFVKVQTSLERVSKSKWDIMEKIIYFVSKEEVENPDKLCKCRVDAKGASLTTCTLATHVHFRLVSNY